MDIKKYKLLVAAFFVACLASYTTADFTKRIDSVIRRSSQKKVHFSVNIIKADTAKRIYCHNVQEPLIPASNMKIITTAAALKYLGPCFEYKTQVGLWGNNLVIISSGDPLLGDKETNLKYGRENGWIFKDIISKLKKQDITNIEDIIVDSGIFDDQRVHPNWPKAQLNRDYACEVSGLNFNGNCIDMTVENLAGRITVSIEPPTKYVKIRNKIRSISKGRGAVGAYRQPGKPNELVVKGKCRRKQGPFAVAIERPAAFFSFLLYEKLVAAGINVKGKLIESEIGEKFEFHKLAEYKTTLADCLSRCNKDSFGLAAEAFVKTIGAYRNPARKPGGWVSGKEAIDEYLLGLGIRKEEFYIDDGSGLSRENKLSSNAITKVLLDMYKGQNWELYKSSLSVAGMDGTARKHFKDKKYKGRIFGKTGYIAGVKSFSGLCTTERGDYIFSILTDGANGNTREAINDIVKALFD